MFVLSMKMNGKKLAGTLCIVVAVVMLAVLLVRGIGKEIAAKTGADGNLGQSMVVKTNEERVKFLESFGWQVSQEPVEIAEVVLPAEFDEVMTNYNKIQKEQGFDLEKFKGQRTKRYTYEVQNYPGGAENIRANLLVLDNKIIGGDISDNALDGFMQGFSMPKSESE